MAFARLRMRYAVAVEMALHRRVRTVLAASIDPGSE
jgi:hypothetical protein